MLPLNFSLVCPKGVNLDDLPLKDPEDLQILKGNIEGFRGSNSMESRTNFRTNVAVF